MGDEFPRADGGNKGEAIPKGILIIGEYLRLNVREDAAGHDGDNQQAEEDV